MNAFMCNACIHEALANVLLLLLRVYRALMNIFCFEYIQNPFIARIRCA